MILNIIMIVIMAFMLVIIVIGFNQILDMLTEILNTTEEKSYDD